MAFKVNGRDTYNTSIQKFFYGGRKLNLGDVLKGKNKIVNGMEDPSKFGFVFGLLPGFGGLFGWEEPDNTSRLKVYDLFSDRSYSALTYLKKCHSNAKSLALGRNKQAAEELSKYTPTAKNDKDHPDAVESELNGIETLKNKLAAKIAMDNDMFADFSEDIFKAQYNEMKKFVDGFKTICNEHPYYFQSVDGLQDVYKKYYNIHKDPILGGGNEGKIKITCLESMDLRMSALFDAYFNSVYDRNFRRMRLPSNLIRFDCYILVHDMRNVPYDDAVGYIENGGMSEDLTKHMSTILFIFKNCTINIEEIGSFLGTINNTGADDTKFEFTFNYGDVIMSVNSLADYIENPKRQSDSDAFYNVLDINRLNEGMPSGLISKSGGISFENVYSDDWKGILASILSTVTNTDTETILNDLYTNKNDNLIGEYIDETGDNVYDGVRTTIVDFADRVGGKLFNNGVVRENVYGEIPEHTSFGVDGNVYTDNTNPLPTSVPENIYDNTVPDLDVSDNIYTDNTNPLPTPVPENIYDNIVPDLDVSDNIYTDNTNPLPTPVPENIYDNTVPDLDVSDNIYDNSVNGNTHDSIVGGETVYTNVQSGTEGLTAGSVYDGITLTHSNYIVEYAEMFTGAEHGELQGRENVYGSVEEHTHYVTSDNVYDGEVVVVTSVRDENVYSNSISTHEVMQNENAYGSMPSHTTYNEDENVYGTVRINRTAHIGKENVYGKLEQRSNTPNKGNVYDGITVKSHTAISNGNIYDGGRVAPSNAIRKENVYGNVTVTHKPIESDSVYKGVRVKSPNGVSGKVDIGRPTNQKGTIENENIYSKNNAVTHNKIVQSNVYGKDTAETKEGFKGEQVYDENELPKPTRPNGNVYANVKEGTHGKLIQDMVMEKAPTPNVLQKENVYEHRTTTNRQLKDESVYTSHPSNPPSGPKA